MIRQKSLFSQRPWWVEEGCLCCFDFDPGTFSFEKFGYLLTVFLLIFFLMLGGRFKKLGTNPFSLFFTSLGRLSRLCFIVRTTVTPWVSEVLVYGFL